MAAKVLKRTDRVTFDKTSHTYTLDTGIELMPVSSVLSMFEQKFDRDGISRKSAEKFVLDKLKLKKPPVDDDGLKAYNKAVSEKIEDLLKGWKAIGDDSMNFGNDVDDAFTNSLIGKPYPQRYSGIISQINSEHNYYKEELGQVILFSEKFGVCGTADRISLRPYSYSSKDPGNYIIDISDYKTGKNKGITFDSTYISKDDGRRKSNKKFLSFPINHIEQCTYSRYCLQLSLYAFLLEEMYGFTIGRLKIIYVHIETDGSLSVENIPVPYLKMEAQAMLETKGYDEHQQRPLTDAECFKQEPVKNEREWGDFLTMPICDESDIFEELSEVEF